MLLLFISVVLKQTKDGSELVTIYGTNVQKVKELNDKLFSAQVEYDDLNSTYQELKTKMQAIADSNATEANATKNIGKTIDINSTH